MDRLTPKLVYLTTKQLAYLDAQEGSSSKIIRELIDSYMDAKKPRTLEEIKLEKQRVMAQIEYEEKLEKINGQNSSIKA